MKKDTVVPLHLPSLTLDDPLTGVIRNGARLLIQKAVEAELASLLIEYQELVDADGRRLIVRNGYLPERTVKTGIGSVEVRVPRVRDRREKKLLMGIPMEMSNRRASGEKLILQTSQGRVSPKARPNRVDGSMVVSFVRCRSHHGTSPNPRETARSRFWIIALMSSDYTNTKEDRT